VNGLTRIATISGMVDRVGEWLIVRFESVHAVASWAIVGGGIRQASAVAWRRVAERTLRPPVDAVQWLRARMSEAALGDAVGLLTSRDLDSWVESRSDQGGARAHCVATVGLGNALRAGDPPGAAAHIGTINVLCRVDLALTREALLEALAIATEAKTAAVLDASVVSRRSGKRATGTGTDCIVIAAPLGSRRAHYAGKHTAVGAAIGAAVLSAVRTGARQWSAHHERKARP
jgi:adenosylcobinamide amidohydrolase